MVTSSYFVTVEMYICTTEYEREDKRVTKHIDVVGTDVPPEVSSGPCQ